MPAREDYWRDLQDAPASFWADLPQTTFMLPSEAAKYLPIEQQQSPMQPGTMKGYK